MTISTLMLWGDSLTAGTGHQTQDGKPGNWAELVTEQLANLRQLGPVISSGIRIPSCGGWTRAGAAVQQSLGGDNTAANKAPYGVYLSGAAQADVSTYTVPTQWRTSVGFALYWTDTASGTPTGVTGNWQYRIDGGTWTNMGQTLNGNNSLNKFYVSTAVTSTLDIRGYNGSSACNYAIVGIELYWSNPTVAGVRGLTVHNCGVPATILDSLAAPGGSADLLAVMDSVVLGTGSPPSPTPTLGVVMMHYNDTALNDVTLWGNDLTTFINRVRAVSGAPPCGLMSPWEGGNDAAVQATYRARTKTIAAGYSSPTVSVLDWFDNWNARGWGAQGVQNATLQTISLLLADTVHLDTYGHQLIAEGTGPWLRTTVFASGTFGDDLNAFTIGSSSVGSTDVLGGIPALTTTCTASDTASGTDSATRAALALTRTGSDTASGTDAATRTALTPTRTCADTASGTDSASRAVTLPTRTCSETASGTDVATLATADWTRTATDVAAGSDAATRSSTTTTRTATDTADGTEAATRNALSLTRTTADTAAGSDTAGTERRVTTTETAGGTDIAVGAVVRTRTCTDTASGTDVAAQSGRTATDLANGTDTSTRSVQTYTRTVADGAAGNDAATRAVARQRTTTDTASGTDAAVRSAQTRVRTISDAAVGTDTVVRSALTRLRTTSDTAAGNDLATRVRNLPRTTTDVASGTDQAAQLRSLVRTLSDVAAGSDAVHLIKHLFVTVSDGANGTDIAFNLKHIATPTKVVVDLSVNVVTVGASINTVTVSNVHNNYAMT